MTKEEMIELSKLADEYMKEAGILYPTPEYRELIHILLVEFVKEKIL